MNPKLKNRNEVAIPTGGRLGRLAKAIAKETNREVLLKVMKDVNQYETTSDYAAKAAWIRGAVERLDRLVGEEKSNKIMESCGRRCFGPTARKRVRELKRETKSIEEFINRLNEVGIGGGRLHLKNKNTIAGGYDRCYCGLVKHTRQAFPKLTYCWCSVGWYKQLFESALEKPVEVEIKQAIISGAKSCEFTIHI